MRIEIDENSRVVQWSIDDTSNELLFDIPEGTVIPDDFEENAFFYRYEDGAFIFDEEYKTQQDYEHKVAQIRQDRADICFPVVNRGGLWYDLLTENQKSEMLEWYMAWLDATETLVEPETPEWLKEML